MGAAPQIAEAIRQLTVAPLAQDDAGSLRDLAVGSMRALVRTELNRQIAQTRIRLQRLAPDDPEYTELFAALMEMDTQRRMYADLVSDN